MSDFDLLSSARKEVKEFTRRHRLSIDAFRAEGRDWFKIDVDELDSSQTVRHKTTTASCIESLADLQAAGHFEADDLRDLATKFATNALAESKGRWQSEGAAYVYCRVRTLPAILAHADEEALRQCSKKIVDHLKHVWSEVGPAPRKQAIYEQPTPGGKEEEEKARPTYPPNAFHTFWALRMLSLARKHAALQDAAATFADQRHIAMLWMQNALASQIALYDAHSDRADAHQLAWALAAQFVDDPAERDELAVGEFAGPALYRIALAAFFGQQLESGSWRLGQPIFHYPRAGNAYCYTYETLTELIRPALQVSTGRVYRDLLRQHLAELLKAWEYARQTAIPLADPTAVGWCSGHHPHRTYAEGWATAVTFSFLQCFRRLIGIWTREEAERILGVRPPGHESQREAVEELGARGKTWTGGKRWSAGEQLSALFFHPVRANAPERDHEDPDLTLVEENQARSAILFGPPGTSKTALAEAVAGAIGWGFVEIHASDFLSEGMDQVPRRADDIFSKLMELDHCVILFDEIDELLRARKDELSDPFGRFLTTSMLPKVAGLWRQGRVLFFVATNDITQADEAIQRSQRFDAAIFVAPPSYSVKASLLAKRLGNGKLPFSEEEAEKDLDLDPKEHPLGYFALLRWDQVDELGAMISNDQGLAAVKEALREMGPRLAVEADPYKSFRKQQQAERRDHRRLRLIWVAGSQIDLEEGLEPYTTTGTGIYMRVMGLEERPPAAVNTDDSSATPDEALRYEVRDEAG